MKLRAIAPSNNIYSSHSVTDESLVFWAKSGDHSAFAELSVRHSKKIYKTIYGIIKHPQDAEDLVQETLLKAFIKLNTFDGRSMFSTWLTRIAINSSLMLLRRRRSHPEHLIIEELSKSKSLCDLQALDSRADPENHYVIRERYRYLESAIGKLRPSLRIVVELQRIHDCTVKETAERAGISLAATKSRLSRARAELCKLPSTNRQVVTTLRKTGGLAQRHANANSLQMQPQNSHNQLGLTYTGTI